MRSMTGFGIGEARISNGQLSVELRSVNHKYCDVRVRLSPDLADHAFFVEQLARQRLTRGRFDVSVKLENAAEPSHVLDTVRARQTYSSLCALRDELDPGSHLPFTALLSVPSLFTAVPLGSPAELRAAIDTALSSAVLALTTMREHEGQAIAAALEGQAESARVLVAHCRQKSEQMSALYHSKLTERLRRLLAESSVTVDELRLGQEIAILADRSDATEELNRLESHLQHFVKYLHQDEPVGRRLDFLLQEIAREANTLGAKSQDASLAMLVVELKAEIERMREQVQNVE